MKIVKCSKCGKYIHKVEKCFHCGNTKGFDTIYEIVVHENVNQEYARMELMVEEKKYDEAIALSYTVLEWMPKLASVFWLRLLAKNKCSNANDLICKGFPCDEDPDFCNALSFSMTEEHCAYEDIQKAVSEIRILLKKEILENEYKCKSSTNIMQIKAVMQDEIESRQQKLFSLWSDLVDTEHSIYGLEADCRLITKEYQMVLEKAAQVAFSIKSQVYLMEECTVDKLHYFQVQLLNALQQSESSMKLLETMRKENPLVKSFLDQVAQRNQKVKLINSEIESLKSYEATVQQTLTEIEHIENSHKNTLIAVDKYDFTSAMSLLGVDAFNEIICSVDMGNSSSISLVAERGLRKEC